MAVSRLVEQLDNLDPEAAELVVRCDRATADLASQARRYGEASIETLAAAGIPARLRPVPSRLPYCTFQVALNRDGAWPLPNDLSQLVEAAITALEETGYRPQQRIDREGLIDWIGRNPSIPLIHENATIRLELQWRDGQRDNSLSDRSLPLDSITEETDLGVFLGTPTSLIGDILELAMPSSNDVLMDLGCGDGRVLIEAALIFGCRGTGIESDPALVAKARSNIVEAGLEGMIEIREADASSVDLAGFTLVFAFLPPAIVSKLIPGVLSALQPGARLITHEQLRIEWSVEPDRSQLIVVDHLTVAHLWTRSENHVALS